MSLSPRRRLPGAAARSVWPPLPLAAQQDPQTEPVETNFFFFFLRKRKQKKNPTKIRAQHSAKACGPSTRPSVPCSPAVVRPGEASSSAALGARQRLVPDSRCRRGPSSARPRRPDGAREGTVRGAASLPGSRPPCSSLMGAQPILQILQARSQLGK